MTIFSPNVDFIRDIREIQPSQFLDELEDEASKALALQNAAQLSVYGFKYESNGEWVDGFISFPRTIPPTAKLPCVVVNRQGTKDFGYISPKELFINSYSWLPLENHIGIMTNCPADDKMGGTEDTASILRLYDVLKLVPEADLNRIGMFGWSRGGQAVYQCLREKPEWLKTAVSIAGAADHINQMTWRKRDDWKTHLDETFGGSQEECIARSALYWADEMKVVPLLLIHGDTDDRVWHMDSVNLSAKLPNSKLILYHDDHALSAHIDSVRIEVIEWFKKYL
jgi:hypothetical protein